MMNLFDSRSNVVRAVFRSVQSMRGGLGVAFVSASVLALGASCKAGTSADSSSFGGSGNGGNSGSANGGSSGDIVTSASTGSGFITTTNTTGSGTDSCTSMSCIGGGTQGGCDGSLAIDSSTAMDGAKAIGLCQAYSSGGWGVESAAWVQSDGNPLSGANAELGKGILTHFGSVVTPREGKQLLALSSGTARNPTDPGYQDVSGFDKGYTSGYPAGFNPNSSANPESMLGCGTTGQPHDSAGLQLKIMTPTDAKSLSFNINFYTYEFPNYVCSTYNDFMVAMMNPPPANAVQGDISFDTKGDLISVNAGFLTVCVPQMDENGTQHTCPTGPAQLAGTGFDTQMNFDDDFNQIEGSASTGWLETQAPVTPGSEITLTFAVWDSGDGVLDSTCLIDNFKFQLSDSTTSTTPIPS